MRTPALLLNAQTLLEFLIARHSLSVSHQSSLARNSFCFKVDVFSESWLKLDISLQRAGSWFNQTSICYWLQMCMNTMSFLNKRMTAVCCFEPSYILLENSALCVASGFFHLYLIEQHSKCKMHDTSLFNSNITETVNNILS